MFQPVTLPPETAGDVGLLVAEGIPRELAQATLALALAQEKILGTKGELGVPSRKRPP